MNISTISSTARRSVKIFCFLSCLLWATPSWAQIAFDAFTDGTANGGTTSSLSWSHTSTGSNRVGFIGCAGDIVSGADDFNLPTWTGGTVSLVTKITTFASGTVNARFLYLWFVAGQSSGSQTVTVTTGSNHFIICGSLSYTGAASVGTSTTQTSASQAATTQTTSLTTTADNSWTIMLAEVSSGGGPPGAGTGSTFRGTGSFNLNGFFDSNAVIHPAGSTSMTTTAGVSNNAGISQIMVELKLPSAGGTCMRSLRRVGC